MGAVQKRRVGAWLELDVLGARVDLRQRVRVTYLVHADELQVARLADGLHRGVRVGGAGNLHQDGVGTLLLDAGLSRAQGVDALLDDLHRGCHLVAGGGGAVLLGGGHDDGDTALDVQAAGDLVAKRREAPHADRHANQQHEERAEIAPPVCARAAVARAATVLASRGRRRLVRVPAVDARLLLVLVVSCHADFLTLGPDHSHPAEPLQSDM